MIKKEKYRYLFGNMALFTASNFVSKLLVMLLVPFYTNVLTTSEYGIADVMQATLLLLVPLVTLNAGESALRFGLEKENNQADILRIGLKRILISIGLVTLVCMPVILLAPTIILRTYFCLFVFLYICDCIYEYLLLFCQGTERVKVMILGSVSCTILVICSNLYFLLVQNMGLYGYLFSQMISFLGASIFMAILLKIGKEVSVWKKDTVLEREMTSYGSSMLLYSTSSWVNNAIDRYFVLAMCGSAINGLYGVAYKIPAILIVVQRIFAQAWQMSATKNYKEEDRGLFFSSMYEAYHAIMIVGCSFLIVIVRLIAKFMFAKEFFEAWVLVPPLLISVIFGALTGFLGSICLAFKDGKSMGQATGIGALVNIILNSVGIYYIGAMGAAIATMISYYVMYVVSYSKVKKHCELKIARKKDYISYGIILVQAVLIIKQISGYFVLNSILFLVLLCIYGKQLWKIVKRIGER